MLGEFSNPDGTPMYWRVTDEQSMISYPDKPDVGSVFVSITFADASGNAWRADTDGNLTRTGTVKPQATDLGKRGRATRPPSP